MINRGWGSVMRDSGKKKIISLFNKKLKSVKLWPWALVILKMWRHSRGRLTLLVKPAYLFTLDFWACFEGHDLLFHLLCFFCPITDIFTFQNMFDFTCYSCRLRSHGLLCCRRPVQGSWRTRPFSVGGFTLTVHGNAINHDCVAYSCNI